MNAQELHRTVLGRPIKELWPSSSRSSVSTRIHMSETTFSFTRERAGANLEDLRRGGTKLDDKNFHSANNEVSAAAMAE